MKFFVFIDLFTVQLSGNIIDHRLNTVNYASNNLSTSIKMFKLRN